MVEFVELIIQPSAPTLRATIRRGQSHQIETPGSRSPFTARGITIAAMFLQKDGAKPHAQRGTITDEERQLLADAQAVGRVPCCEEALGRLFTTYKGRLTRFFRKKGQSEDVAQDLLQETFLRVQNKKKSAHFENLRRFEAWLFTIARSTLDHRQQDLHAKKRIPNPLSLDAITDGQPSSFRMQVDSGHRPSPLDQAMAHQELRQVLDEFAKMPPKMRRSAAPCLLQERTTTETATLMRVSPGTVKAQIYQARKRLKAALEADSTPSSRPERG